MVVVVVVQVVEVVVQVMLQTWWPRRSVGSGAIRPDLPDSAASPLLLRLRRRLLQLRLYPTRPFRSFLLLGRLSEE